MARRRAEGLPGRRRIPHRPRPAGRLWRRPLGARAAMKQAALRRYRTQIDAIDDDPDGFTITPALLARFGRPVEVFGSRP